jgi:hypothetical protein
MYHSARGGECTTAGELATASAKIAKVENRERALISDYSILHGDYGDLESVFYNIPCYQIPNYLH